MTLIISGIIGVIFAWRLQFVQILAQLDTA
jgi:hypothetical protein